MGLVPGLTRQLVFYEEVPVRWAHAALRDVVGAPETCLPPTGPLHLTLCLVPAVFSCGPGGVS